MHTDKFKFTDRHNTLGVIYVVRDPRNIVFPLSQSFQLSEEQSLNSLLSKKANENQKGLILGTAYSSQAAARFLGQPFAGLVFLNLGKNYPFYFDIIFFKLINIV